MTEDLATLLLLVVNAVVGVTSTGLAVLAALRPKAMSHSAAPTGGERFYALMYAARGVPLGLLAAAAPLVGPGPAAALAVVTAAVAQLLDAVIGAGRREVRMVAGAGLAAAVHALTAVVIW